MEFSRSDANRNSVAASQETLTKFDWLLVFPSQEPGKPNSHLYFYQVYHGVPSSPSLGADFREGCPDAQCPMTEISWTHVKAIDVQRILGHRGTITPFSWLPKSSRSLVGSLDFHCGPCFFHFKHVISPNLIMVKSGGCMLLSPTIASYSLLHGEYCPI